MALGAAEYAAAPPIALLPLLAGSALTTGIALVLGVPVGVLAAIYLSELARPGLRRALEPLLTALSGVPTIVFAAFALWWIGPTLGRVVPGLGELSALTAGVATAMLIAPIIAIAAARALGAVPSDLRDAATALGIGRFDSIRRVVLPAAAPGVLAAILLGLTRAMGETMIVSVAAGLAPRLTLDPRAPIETLTAFVVHGARAEPAPHPAMFWVGVWLFAFTLASSVASRRLLARRAA